MQLKDDLAMVKVSMNVCQPFSLPPSSRAENDHGIKKPAICCQIAG